MSRFVDRGLARPWKGEAYRFATAKWAEREHFATGVGAFRFGSRWLVPGVAPALHAATTPEGAMTETLARHRWAGMPDWSAMPLVVRAVRVSIRSALDLGLGEIRSSIQVSERRILEENWRRLNEDGHEALTQAIGRAALEAGIEGLLVPSVQVSGAMNLVVFPEALSQGSAIEVL